MGQPSKGSAIIRQPYHKESPARDSANPRGCPPERSRSNVQGMGVHRCTPVGPKDGGAREARICIGSRARGRRAFPRAEGPRCGRDAARGPSRRVVGLHDDRISAQHGGPHMDQGYRRAAQANGCDPLDVFMRPESIVWRMDATLAKRRRDEAERRRRDLVREALRLRRQSAAESIETLSDLNASLLRLHRSGR